MSAIGVDEASLRASLEERSDVLLAADDATSVFKQLTFSAQTTCAAFEPNPFKKDRCVACMQLVTAHYRCTITSQRDCMAALEFLSSAPSLVYAGDADHASVHRCVNLGSVAGDASSSASALPSPSQSASSSDASTAVDCVQSSSAAVGSVQARVAAVCGHLYLGGFKAAMSDKTLAKLGITHVLNTAEGLEVSSVTPLLCCQSVTCICSKHSHFLSFVPHLSECGRNSPLRWRGRARTARKQRL
jgi:hypothetical protein